MARAARGLAFETAALLAAHRGAGPGGGEPGHDVLDAGAPDAHVLVLAGAGNNGGDALFAAALLADHGARVSIVPTSDRLHREGLEVALAAGAALRPPDESPAVVAELAREADVILDGILGTGVAGDPVLRGPARTVVGAILPLVSGAVAGPGRRPLVVAVDLPSGIGVDDGRVPDTTVLPADLTVTFGGIKSGLVRRPAADYTGRLVVVDIGIGEELERIRGRDLALGPQNP
jgi:NAD(P)H-hydrate epimerase